jgi:plastocyanin
VNGLLNPAIPIRPGETQRWRILNASANAFFNLTLDGHQLHRIELDGNPLPHLETVERELLGPGERATVLVQRGPAGIYELRSEPWGELGQAQQGFTVATLVVAGDEEEPATLPDALIPFRDLSDAPIARQRTITFQEQTVDPVFAIDGQGFDPDRVDQTVTLNTIEEWVIRNESPDWHPFHIHVNDFQVISINGQPVTPRYEDTIGIPPQGEVVVRIPFLDFTGKFVYHCHILVHEDFGMMAVVEVVAPEAITAGIDVVATGLASPRGMAWDDDGTLYVAQAGTGETATSVGPAASLVRIDGGCPVEVASGLPSSFDPFRDVLGPEDVAILDRQFYVLQGATGLLDEKDPATPNGVYAVEADGSLRLVADLTTWILANPTALTPGAANPLGEPYRMRAGEGSLWVLEVNRGELLWVTLDGEVSRVADLSANHPVWTALAVTPDGGVYAGTLTPAPFLPGTARVISVTPDGEVRDVWTGLTTVTGLEFPIALALGPDGALYAALPAYGTNDQAGAIVRIDLAHPWPMAFDASVLADSQCPGAASYVPPGANATPESLAGMHGHVAATPVAAPGDPNAPGAQAVEIRDYAYQPPTLTIPSGTTVTWMNSDPVPHTATSTDGAFDSGALPSGTSVSLRFETPGTFDYSCLYHPNMQGTVVVT